MGGPSPRTRRRPPVLFVAAAALALAVAGCSGAREGVAPISTVPPAPVPTSTGAPGTTSVPGTTAPATSSTSSAAPAFAWRSSSLSPSTEALMEGRSWRPGCPVPLSGLRMLELTYWGFDATAHWGQMVVNSDAVTSVVGAFRSLFEARFPVRQMRLVDYFGGDDERSMAADNTSAFNCRLVPGTSTWSQHAYGRAVDVDPLENPEIRDGQIDPPGAAPFADRSQDRPGMISHGDWAWRAFAAVGWKWGGDWVSLQDYQHFSANGY